MVSRMRTEVEISGLIRGFRGESPESFVHWELACRIRRMIS